MSSFVISENVGGVLVARTDREKIGEYESPVIKSEIEAQAPAANWRIVLDLADVRMVASAGLGVLVSLNKICKEKGGKFAICGLDPMLKQVFEMTKLHRVLTICETRDAAIKAAT